VVIFNDTHLLVLQTEYERMKLLTNAASFSWIWHLRTVPKIGRTSIPWSSRWQCSSRGANLIRRNICETEIQKIHYVSTSNGGCRSPGHCQPATIIFRSPF